MVSEEALEEFKKIWKEEYGTDISNQDALESATSLLTMFDAIYRPIRKEWSDDYDFEHGLTIDAVRWLSDEPEMSDKEANEIKAEMIRLRKLLNERRKEDALKSAGKDGRAHSATLTKDQAGDVK